MKRVMKGLYVVLLSATAAATLTASPARAARTSLARASGPETGTDVSNLRLPDPTNELRHLSKNLRLTRSQRTVVSSILQERAREIRLLLDVEPLSQEYRNTLATKVMEDTNVQIETLLRNKQKRKFDKQLAKDRAVR